VACPGAGARLRGTRLMLRRAAFVAALILLASMTIQPSPAADAYTIDVIVNETGANAFVGRNEMEAIKLYERLANSQGGINGRPVHFEFYDDQTDPRLSVQLANQLIAKHPVAILGSGNAATCAAIAPLMENGPVDYCFTPGYAPKSGGYVFAASASLHLIVPANFIFARGKTWLRVGIFSTSIASGQAADVDTRYAMTLPENRDVKIVDWETFNPADVTAVAEAARLKAAKPQVILTPASGAAFATLLRSMNDVGLHVPIVASAANMQPAQLKQYVSFLPGDLYFNGMVYYARDTIRPGPLLTAVDQFYSAYKAAGVEPTPDSGQGWDPALIVVSALRHLGTDTTPAKLHDYLMSLHGFAGVNGIYDFRTGDQHGLGLQSIIFVKYDVATGGFVNATKPGGAPL
jgi:branched-chain amino acid transport system substrate-binding protein